jgi:hypothetical protein
VPMHGQRLGEEIRHVDGARDDVPHDEMALGHAVLKSVEPHITRLGELRFDGLLG